MTRDRTDQHKPGSRLDGLPGNAKAKPLSPDLQAHIGVRLKAYYDSVLSEPIPDRFAQLLDRLDTAEESPSARDGASEPPVSDGTRVDPPAEAVLSGTTGGERS